MIRSLDPANEQFLNALSQLQERLRNVQTQLSTGLKIQRASDAPERVINVIRQQSEIAHSQQVLTNMSRLKAEVDSAEAGLQKAVQAIEQAIALGSQALSSPLGAIKPQILAQQAAGLHEEMVRLALTTAEGRFVFGGDTDQQAPYQINLANANGVDRLTTSAATRLVLDFDGSRFLAGRTAGEIFDHRQPDDSLAPDNAFAALHGLRTAIESGDRAQLEAAQSSLRAAHGYLSQQLAFYGGMQKRVSMSLDQGQQLGLRGKTRLGEIRDADVAAAAVELTRIQTNIEAAIRAQASARTVSLFDFLA